MAEINADYVAATDFQKRFDARIEKRRGKNPCWVWTGTIRPKGYGEIQIRRKSILAHRFSYALHVGPIPDGAVIHHKCENKSCVNPKHLEAVTPRVNTTYARNK